MLELRDIIRLLRESRSIREIHRTKKVHRTIIREVKDLAEKNGWLEEKSGIPTERELHIAKYGHTENIVRAHPLDVYYEDFKLWIKEEYTFVVMHRLVKEKCPCDESTVRRYVKKRFPKIIRPVISRNTIAGEIMEVDFGYFGLVLDDFSGKHRKAWFFSGRLRHSKRTFREIVFDQKQQTFFSCHINAFEYFGGVPEKVVPDNLKAAIIKAAIYDPVVNRGYIKLAEHYGFLISPCLPRMPQHKGGVENDVKYVKRNFLPVFKEELRRAGKDISYIWEMQNALNKWNDEVADIRIVSGIGKSPLEMFEEEKTCLKILPKERFDPVSWKECRVPNNFSVQFEKAYYSVPYRLIGKSVFVCGNSTSVYIFHKYEEVAMHSRAVKDWERKIKTSHAPEAYKEYLSTTRVSLLRRAENIGGAIYKVVEQLFNDRTFDQTRSVRGIFSLGKKYSWDRLESACNRALFFENVRYTSVKNILKNNMDKLPLEVSLKPEKATEQVFKFSRDYGYFSSSN